MLMIEQSQHHSGSIQRLMLVSIQVLFILRGLIHGRIASKERIATYDEMWIPVLENLVFRRKVCWCMFSLRIVPVCASPLVIIIMLVRVARCPNPIRGLFLDECSVRVLGITFKLRLAILESEDLFIALL